LCERAFLRRSQAFSDYQGFIEVALHEAQGVMGAITATLQYGQALMLRNVIIGFNSYRFKIVSF